MGEHVDKSNLFLHVYFCHQVFSIRDESFQCNASCTISVFGVTSWSISHGIIKIIGYDSD